MPDDDDLDCPEHDWTVVELLIDKAGARVVEQCTRCEAIRYEPSRSDA